MEIIKRGQVVNCKKCESVLRYETKDVQTSIRYDYRGEDYEQKYVTCPVCQTKINL